MKNKAETLALEQVTIVLKRGGEINLADLANGPNDPTDEIKSAYYMDGEEKVYLDYSFPAGTTDPQNVIVSHKK